MSEICSKCGLPKALCVCEVIAKEAQIIKITTIKRKFGKLITVITGISSRDIDLKELAKKLKSKLACGGTVKNDAIELQGGHKQKVKEELVNMGFARETIDTK